MEKATASTAGSGRRGSLHVGWPDFGAADLMAAVADDRCATARHLLERWGPDGASRGSRQADWRVWNAGAATARTAVAARADRLADLAAPCAPG